MKFEITLRVTTPDGEIEEREVIVLDKGHDRHEDTGLSVEEGKALLKTLQHKIVEAQTEAFCASKAVCRGCKSRLRRKGTHAIRYRTVFGDIAVKSPLLPLSLQWPSSQDLQPSDRTASRPHGARALVAGNPLGFAGVVRRLGPPSQGCPARR